MPLPEPAGGLRAATGRRATAGASYAARVRTLLASIGRLAAAGAGAPPREATPVGSVGSPASRGGSIAGRPAAAALAVTVTADSVAINGTPIGPRPTLAEVAAVLGDADRVIEAYNHIHVYDRLGVAVYQASPEHPAAGRVLQISIFYQREPSLAVVPASVFTGALTVHGKAVPLDATIAAIRAMYPALAYDGEMDEYTLTVRGENVWFSHVDGGDQLLEVAISFDET